MYSGTSKQDRHLLFVLELLRVSLIPECFQELGFDVQLLCDIVDHADGQPIGQNSLLLRNLQFSSFRGSCMIGPTAAGP